MRATTSRASSGSASRARTRRTSAPPSSPRSPSATRVCEHVHLPLQSGPARSQAHAPDLRPRSLPPARRDAPRGRARSRARHRHHRRLPRRDGGGLRGDARGRRGRALRQRIHVHLLAAGGNRGGRACRTRYRTRSSTSGSSASSSRAADRRRAQRGAGRPHRGGARRGREPDRRLAAARPDAPQHDCQLRGRGMRQATSSTCWSRASTSTTLRGRELAARRRLTLVNFTLSARFVTHTYGFRRYARSGWWAGVPEGNAGVSVRFSPSSGRPPPASPTSPKRSPTARHRGRLRRRAAGLSRPSDPDQPAARPTRLVAIRALDEEMSVGEYAGLAHDAVDELVAANGSAVVAGGTGLYLRAALADLALPPPPPPGARERWEAAYDADPSRRARQARRARPGGGRDGAPERPASSRPRARARGGRRLPGAGAGSALVGGDAPADARRRPERATGDAGPAHPHPRPRRCSRRGVGRRGARSAVAAGVSRTAEKALGLRELAELAPTRRSSGSSRERVATPLTSESGCGAFPGSS